MLLSVQSPISMLLSVQSPISMLLSVQSPISMWTTEVHETSMAVCITHCFVMVIACMKPAIFDFTTALTTPSWGAQPTARQQRICKPQWEVSNLAEPSWQAPSPTSYTPTSTAGFMKQSGYVGHMDLQSGWFCIKRIKWCMLNQCLLLTKKLVCGSHLSWAQPSKKGYDTSSCVACICER